MTAADRMKKLKQVKRCEHVHVSGRHCGQPAGRNRRTCGLHPDSVDILPSSGAILAACIECNGMLQTFTPPRGW